MRSILRKSSPPYGLFLAMFTMSVALLGSLLATRVQASSAMPANGQRLITIHDNGHDKTILSDALTLRQAFKQAHIPLDSNDMVEPGLDEPLVARNYEVNIYRARPVIIVDGAIRQKVMSPYRTARQIVTHAGMSLHDEDITTMGVATDMVSDGAGVELTIKRATSFTLVLYGKKTQAYTQAKTVAAMLADKGIKMGQNDTLSVAQTSPLQAGMTVELWRNGKQTVTEDQPIPFDVQQIQDTDQPVGYRDVKTPGVNGIKTVTYEVDMHNGHEVGRKEIQSVVMKQPQKQVEVVGAKPAFSGDFAAALAKLRSCEGGYNSWNPAGPYYGAYQFDQRTWNTNAPAGAPYGSATPAQQDQAARNLYVRRGWSPWPVCGARLPDIYR